MTQSKMDLNLPNFNVLPSDFTNTKVKAMATTTRTRPTGGKLFFWTMDYPNVKASATAVATGASPGNLEGLAEGVPPDVVLTVVQPTKAYSELENAK